MEIEYDEEKRRRTLQNRGLDFRDAPIVFADIHIQIEDARRDYGETRYRVFGWLEKRRVVLVWTPRDPKRRIIMMRYAHEEEFDAFKGTLD